MLKYLIFGIMIANSALASQSQIDVVYGADNRKDYFEASLMQKQLSASVAGLVSINRFTKGRRTNFFDIAGSKSLEDSQRICPSEKFSEQMTAPFCTGFLVAPDVIVTAGHCYLQNSTAEERCKNSVWVFDYAQSSRSSNPTQDIPLQNIYTCEKVLGARYAGVHDFTVVKLSRKVTGRAPLKFRTSGKISSSASIMVMGHPSGLPMKISDGAKLTYNLIKETFSTNLDTFHGNSGSPVFDARTGVVEGILVQGKTDYIPSDKKDPQSCLVVNKCDNNAKKCEAPAEGGTVANGEVVYRITNISKALESLLR